MAKRYGMGGNLKFMFGLMFQLENIQSGFDQINSTERDRQIEPCWYCNQVVQYCEAFFRVATFGDP